MGIDYGISGYSEDYGFKGYIMKENEIVAVVDNNIIKKIDEKAPIYLKRTKNYKTWIEDRGADITRSKIRNIMRALNLPRLNVVPGVYYVHSACITDKFWTKGEKENVKYEDILFKGDDYFKAALAGDPNLFSLAKRKTPELTNIGSFDKGWKLLGGEWYLYKSGTELQIFSELFVSKLGEELGLDMVRYFIDKSGKYIVSKNFVKEDESFETIKGIITHVEDYNAVINSLEEYGLQKNYMDLMFLDAVVGNSDRHELNFGVLVKDSGDIILAPNYDNNLALFSDGIPNDITIKREDDIRIINFIEIYREYDYTLPILNEVVLEKVYNNTLKEYKIDVPKKEVMDYCINGYNQIIKGVPEQKQERKPLDVDLKIVKKENYVEDKKGCSILGKLRNIKYGIGKSRPDGTGSPPGTSSPGGR